MDPALWELFEGGNPQEEVAAIIRLRNPLASPPGVRLVSQFGDIATCRLTRADILKVRAYENVRSLKAPRLYSAEMEVPPSQTSHLEQDELDAADERRSSSLTVTGRGVVIGVVDWGCDFAHTDFRRSDGSTRLLGIWDQRADQARLREKSPAPYGYGVFHSAEEINRALAADDPYTALSYHPAAGDPDNTGSHGTHVFSIAAGIASEAHLVFVHPSPGLVVERSSVPQGRDGLVGLGDSVALLEGLDFIARLAGALPWVANLSMGRHAGSHDGSTLVEQGFDQLLVAAPGRAIIQSTGNYFNSRVHVAGQMRPGEERIFFWETDPADVTPNELDLWYPSRDRLVLELRSPDSAVFERVALGQRAALTVNNQKIGNIYHREHDPNNHDHQIGIFLHPTAPAGRWQIKLIGEDVVDGRFHAWIERDAASTHCQSQFDLQDAVPFTTTGTICNGFRTIAVGAYDARSPERPVAPFSSSGPTRDGRQKPDLVAPGVQVLAARSAPRGATTAAPLFTRKSGTSMAAPHVTGTVALMFEVAPRPLTIQETRSILLTSATRPGVEISAEIVARIGSGYLNIESAIEAARLKGLSRAPLAAQPDEQEHTTTSKGVVMQTQTETQIAEQESADLNRSLLEGPIKAEQNTNALTEGEIISSSRQSELVQSADEAIAAGEVSRSSGALLHKVLSDSTGALNTLGIESFPSPAAIFDVFAYPHLRGPRRYLEEVFEVLARPGERLPENLRAGDLLVRRALGEGALAHVSLLVTGRPVQREALAIANLNPLSRSGGYFAHVIEGGAARKTLGDRQARQLANRHGRLDYDQMLLRPRRSVFGQGFEEQVPGPLQKVISPNLELPSWCFPQIKGVPALLCQIFFATNNAELDAADKAQLDNLVNIIAAQTTSYFPGDKNKPLLLLPGHADPRTTTRPGGNEQLSIDRSRSVHVYLTSELDKRDAAAGRAPGSWKGKVEFDSPYGVGVDPRLKKLAPGYPFMRMVAIVRTRGDDFAYRDVPAATCAEARKRGRDVLNAHKSKFLPDEWRRLMQMCKDATVEDGFLNSTDPAFLNEIRGASKKLWSPSELAAFVNRNRFCTHLMRYAGSTARDEDVIAVLHWLHGTITNAIFEMHKQEIIEDAMKDYAPVPNQHRKQLINWVADGTSNPKSIYFQFGRVGP